MSGTGVLVLNAPLRAWAGPLDEAPDPVFAERMLGDGVALDPLEETLRAPCDGVVIALPKTRHAVTLRADSGAEILIHVGLETVALGGEGFEAHVAEGERVRAGDRLLSFDLDVLAGRAASLLTPMVVTNGEAFEIVRRTLGREVAAGEPLMELRPLATAAGSATPAGGDVREVSLAMPLPHGLHARPAARLAACAEGFAAEIELAAAGRSASARSPVRMMTLGVARGDPLTIRASGPDAAAALEALQALLTELAAAETSEPTPEPPPPPSSGPQPAGAIRGVTAAPGLAIGLIVRLAEPEPVVEERGRGAAEETRALMAALDAVSGRLAALAAGGDPRRRELVAAHLAFLSDPELAAAALRAVGEGRSAGAAWRDATREAAATLAGLDERFAERIDDLRDLERQVLLELSGEPPAPPRLPHGAIVAAEELLPSQLMALDATRVAGFCTARGGATSHVAILAQAMGVPALAAAGPELLRVADGASAILDADAGLLHVAPDRATFERAQGELARRDERRRAEAAQAAAPCRTADGARVEVFANLASVAEAEAAIRQGAEGCGLFRTEFLYLDRQAPPSEDEQAAAYQAVADALEGRVLTIRTLDAGGDKPLAFAPAPPEPNPALGLRGVRAGLRAPELLRAQLAAILRVRPAGRRRILLPMVCDLADLRAVRAMLEALPGGASASLGVMIETPASALLADQLAREADFLSIGTNDLTQYVLAMDREHAELAPRLDALHPAVLRLVAQAAEAGRAHGRPVAVCGALASDPRAAPLLVGLGVTELSAAPAAIPALKARLRAVTLDACRALAAEALGLASPAEVRALLDERLPTREPQGVRA